MFNRVFVVAVVTAAALPLAAQISAPAPLGASVERQLPALTETYKHLHRSPELSRHEEQTAAFMAGELRKLGYTVTEHVGKYEDGAPAVGIVAILENGPGPRLLLRTELDALPVEEKTGLDYASTVKTTNSQGQQVGVMHACGHDLHMTVLLGAARELAERKSQWHGTLMLIGQPAEEVIQGAKAMLADHLYERFGTPDFVVSEHDSADVAAGAVAFKGGPLLASCFFGPIFSAVTSSSTRRSAAAMRPANSAWRSASRIAASAATAPRLRRARIPLCWPPSLCS